MNKILFRDIQEIKQLAKSSLDMLSGKKIMITGGGGFLGYELVHLLSQIGIDDGRSPADVYLYDNFIRGKKDWISDLQAQNKIKVRECDISKSFEFDGIDFDYLIHAASIASPSFYRLYPIETIDANINGIRVILEYSKKLADDGKKPTGILYFSTSEIYGDPDESNIPTLETYKGNVSCTGPRACYDESKRVGETLCVNFALKYGLPIKIARPFNNYGPGLGFMDRRLLPDLARNIFENNDLVLYSNGLDTRTFCYISDAITGYLKVLTNGRAGEAYNIGTEFPELTVINFAEKLLRIAKKEFSYSGKIVFRDSKDPNYLIDNPRRRCPNISKAREELEFIPMINLDEGLRRSLYWYSEQRL